MRAVSCLTILSLTWAVSSAVAADTPTHSSDARASSAKRQIVDCMNKRMAASRTVSYNEASRICKDQVNDLLVAQPAPVAASGMPQKAVSAP